MRRGDSSRSTAALVVAGIALVGSFAGGATAARVLVDGGDVKNASLTGADVRNASLTGADIRDRSLRLADLGGNLQALRGPAGPAGPAGARGPAGPPGATVASAPALPDVLPSGATLRGVFAGRAYAGTAGQDMQIPITFQVPLSAAPTTHFIAFAATPPPECPGNPASPAAARGHLCVYESTAAINAVGRVFDPVGGADGAATRFGAGVAASAGAVGDFRVRGSWAVTAP